MLGEGLSSGAAVQFMTYDEAAVDRPRRARVRTALGLLAAAAAAVVVLVLS